MERADSRTGIEAVLGYVFSTRAWLDQALTHKSYVNERATTEAPHNERLEFLGDAVLSLVVTEYLIARLPQQDEGGLSKRKARLVSEECLVQAAQRLGLGAFLKLGRGEELTQGREKPSLLADAFEAITAAIYLDGGLEASRTFILRVLTDELAAAVQSTDAGEAGDFKTRLQEYCQKRFDSLPQYHTIGESGPDHKKCFEVQVVVNGAVWGTGNAHTKKAAEQAAAREALQRLEAGGIP